MKPRSYSYIDAGFDSFLSRSIDEVSQVTLDSQGPPNSAIRTDASQFSGQLGSTIRVGGITINGVAGNIVGNDGTNDFFLLGDE